MSYLACIFMHGDSSYKLLTPVDISYTLEVDPSALQQGIPSRVRLNGTSQTNPGRISSNIKLKKNELQSVATTAILMVWILK